MTPAAEQVWKVTQLVSSPTKHVIEDPPLSLLPLPLLLLLPLQAQHPPHRGG